MDSIDLLSPFQMFAGLSPDELRPVAGAAGEVEIAADAAVTTSTW